MTKVKVVFGGLSEIHFDTSDIVSMEDINMEGLSATLITLRDGKKLYIPLSREDIEERLKEGEEVELKFDL